MHHLHLDYVRPHAPAWPGYVLLATGLILALTCYQFYASTSERNAALEKQLVQLSHGGGKRPAVSNASRLPREELEKDIQRARQRADFLMLPWDKLFAALEDAAMDQVALLAIEPDAKTHQVRLTAEAKNSELLFEYLKRLGQAPQFQGVHLVRHEIREEEKLHPVRFTVLAYWKEGA